MITRIGLAIAIVFFAFGAYAQTPTPTPTPSGYPFTVTGNFSASTGNTIQNGMQSTFEYNISPRWSVRIDDIGLTNPSGVLINMGEGQWKIPANRIFGKNAPPIFIGAHAGLGAVKGVGGGMSFAAGAGLSIDYRMSSFFFIRVVDITDIYSRGLVPQNQQFGNYNNVNVGAGIGFNF